MPDQARPKHIFDRCGLAALSDLNTAEWRALYNTMEQKQREFLSHEAEFRSPAYQWPRDPLHTWSRPWEYPYVFYHLKTWRGSLPMSTRPVVVDLGSGVTFFPFSIAEAGCDVQCTDLDPICAADLPKAAKVVSHHPGSVTFRISVDQRLPFEDASVDALYCVSVLEHVPEFEKSIREIHRVLKPGGIFVLTCDLDLRGDQELGVDQFFGLRAAIQQGFTTVHPEETIHPRDLLKSDTGPFPITANTSVWFRTKQYIKPFIGRKAVQDPAFVLAIFAGVYKKEPCKGE